MGSCREMKSHAEFKKRLFVNEATAEAHLSVSTQSRSQVRYFKCNYCQRYKKWSRRAGLQTTTLTFENKNDNCIHMISLVCFGRSMQNTGKWHEKYQSGRVLFSLESISNFRWSLSLSRSKQSDKNCLFNEILNSDQNNSNGTVFAVNRKARPDKINCDVFRSHRVLISSERPDRSTTINLNTRVHTPRTSLSSSKDHPFYGAWSFL